MQLNEKSEPWHNSVSLRKLPPPNKKHFLSFFKIHAYNLETNSWEEITTKPHDKIGLYPAPRY